MVMSPFDNSAGSLLDGIGKNKGVEIQIKNKVLQLP